MKCRQTGIVAEIYQRMGQQTVNMPGGEIVPSAQRGGDCAEWVGGIEDLLGLPQVNTTTPRACKTTAIGELMINTDVWRVSPQQQARSRRHRDLPALVGEVAAPERRRDQGDAQKHGTQLLRTPPDVLIAFFKAWDEIAKEESAKNPTFKRVLDSQREYASIVVPAKRFMFPPYSFAANYYLAEAKPAPGPRPRKQSSGCAAPQRGARRPFASPPRSLTPAKTSVYPAFALVTLFEEEES